MSCRHAGVMMVESGERCNQMNAKVAKICFYPPKSKTIKSCLHVPVECGPVANAMMMVVEDVFATFLVMVIIRLICDSSSLLKC